MLPSTARNGERHVNSKTYRFLAELGFFWESTVAVVFCLVGVGALCFAIFNFSGLALAVALICLPFAALIWLWAKGLRDAKDDM